MLTIQFLRKTFPNVAAATYMSTLDNALSDCSSVLDVGCGANSSLRYITKRNYSVGVEGYEPAIEKSKALHIHDDYKLLDIRLLPKHFGKKQFDAVIALDVIEHLKKDEGRALLRNMEAIARKKVILITPNGFLPQFSEGNKLNEHLSGWSVDDFLSKGYYVSGLNGWKPLRGEYARLRYKPKFATGLISELTHYLFTRTHPKYSFSLFAIKCMEG